MMRPHQWASGDFHPTGAAGWWHSAGRCWGGPGDDRITGLTKHWISELIPTWGRPSATTATRIVLSLRTTEVARSGVGLLPLALAAAGIKSTAVASSEILFGHFRSAGDVAAPIHLLEDAYRPTHPRGWPRARM